MFVARERELARLKEFLDRALAGQGQVCFVTGDAGSGKTALVTEFARRAQQIHTDLLVAIGNCNAQTGFGDPYLPFREVLSLLTGDVEAKLAQGTISEENANRMGLLLVRSTQILVDVGPHLVNVLIPGSKLIAMMGKAVAEKAGWLDKLEALASSTPKKPELDQPAVEQTYIFEEYTKVVQTLAAQQPLIMVLDDLQWADASSVGLLFHLGRHIGASRILIVGTYRPEDVALGRVGQRHPLESVVNEFKRYFGDIEIDLGQTSEADARQLLDSLLDSEPNELGSSFRQALFELTGGHALFTVELLQEMKERGALVRDDQGRWVEAPALDWHTLPPRVEAIIAERIRRLDHQSRETLTIASVEGEHFTAEVVARVQGREEQELVRHLSSHLERQHRLVQAEGTRRLGRQRLSLYRFWHKPVRAYLYEGLDEAERSYLHEDVGGALETLYGDQTGEIAVQLAWHFEEAGVGEKALDYLCLAGERALGLYAPHEAVQYFTRALEAADRYSMLPTPGVYRARGEAYQELGEFEEAHSDYKTALDLARATDDRHLEWEALLDLGRLWASRDYVQAGEYYEQALGRARSLGDSSATGHSLNRIGNWHLNMDRPQEALPYHEEAQAIFQRLDDAHGVAETLDLLGMASGLGGDLIRSAAYYEEAAALFRELGDRQGLASCLVEIVGGDYLSETLVPSTTEQANILSHGESALEIAREIEYRSGEAYILFSLGLYLGPHGDYDRALRCAQAGLNLAEEIEHHQWMAGAHCALGALYLDLFALPEALAHLEQALILAKQVSSWFWIRCATSFLASTYVLQDEPALAEAVLDAALEPDTPFESMAQRLAWYARGELALAVGDPEGALQIADQLIASAHNLSSGDTIPLLSKLRGQALMALQRTDEAEAELRAASETARARGARPMLWRIHKALGSLYRDTARQEQAEREFELARTIIEDLAANVPDEAVRNNFLRHAKSG